MRRYVGIHRRTHTNQGEDSSLMILLLYALLPIVDVGYEYKNLAVKPRPLKTLFCITFFITLG